MLYRTLRAPAWPNYHFPKILITCLLAAFVSCDVFTIDLPSIASFPLLINPPAAIHSTTYLAPGLSRQAL
ncbi:hypothetical protein PTTG_11350, partial [Puccinia triticina 1-1 BBBD Race 1]